MKLQLSKEQFFDLIQGRRFDDKMKQALFMVLVQGYKYKVAADKAGVTSVQMLGKNCRKIRKSFIDNHKPPGWLSETIVYPQEMKQEVDALKAKIETQKHKLNNKWFD